VSHFSAEDLVHPYPDVLLTLVEEHHLERQTIAAPQRMVGTKPYVAILVVVQGHELGGLPAVRRLVGRACLFARDGCEVVEAKRRGGARAAK